MNTKILSLSTLVFSWLFVAGCLEPESTPISTTECTSDDDCGAGFVCEPTDPAGCGVESNECVQGCHEDSDCGEGEFCDQILCDTCPCPGECSDTVPVTPECASDDDCGAGFVCEPTDPVSCSVESNRCVAGCHEDSDCGEGEFCPPVGCETCPCPSQCTELPEPACPDPSDPAVHYIAESYMDPGICTAIDWLGCRFDQAYIRPECGCGCVDIELPQCASDDDCEAGFVCEPTNPIGCSDESNMCIAGCHEDSDCADDQACNTLYCDTCPCPGECIELTCAGLDETECLASPDCQPGYYGTCDCTCPGPIGYEGGGCEGCSPDCFHFAACVDADHE